MKIVRINLTSDMSENVENIRQIRLAKLWLKIYNCVCKRKKINNKEEKLKSWVVLKKN